MGMLCACAHIPIQKLKSSKTDNSCILNNKKESTRNHQQQFQCLIGRETTQMLCISKAIHSDKELMLFIQFLQCLQVDSWQNEN